MEIVIVIYPEKIFLCKAADKPEMCFSPDQFRQ